MEGQEREAAAAGVRRVFIYLQIVAIKRVIIIFTASTSAKGYL